MDFVFSDSAYTRNSTCSGDMMLCIHKEDILNICIIMLDIETIFYVKMTAFELSIFSHSLRPGNSTC